MTAPSVDIVAAVAEVARARRAELVAVARREGLSPEDAVDCVQDALCTFLKVAQRGEEPRLEAELGPFLIAVTRNAARNKRRRHHLARPHDSTFSVLDETARVASDEADTEALLSSAEEHVRLRSCVDRLCDTQRAVVMLRLLDEQPGDDVAALLGIRRGHVDVLLHRAKARLRVCMMTSGHEDDEAMTSPSTLRASQRGDERAGAKASGRSRRSDAR